MYPTLQSENIDLNSFLHVIVSSLSCRSLHFRKKWIPNIVLIFMMQPTP